MNRITTVLLFCVILYGSKVTFAEQDGKSDEVIGDQEDISRSLAGNETEINSAEEITGPPDSHEAMNNREIAMGSQKTREKRSYEFLMGLINNNSKFEVTKVDPAVTNTKKATEVSGEQLAASELLLELMVRIAAHPNQWENVHQLLQKIDKDILISKNILNDLKKNKLEIKEHNDSKEIHVNKKIIEPTPQSFKPVEISTTEIAKNTDLMKELKSTKLSNKWPHFDQEEATTEPKVTFVNTKETPGKNPWKNENKHMKTAYPKNFAYHRVTGKPIYLNKNPKAYIAVSVIAPKPMSPRSADDEVTLENELRQLKPWTHKQNLKNMASIRSRWVIQTDESKQGNYGT